MQNKKKLFIVGAGNLGRELESWLSLIPPDQSDWKIQGYLCDYPDDLNGFPTDYKILGSIDEFPLNTEDYILLALSNTNDKKHVFNRLQGRAQIFSFIFPNVIVGKFSKIGTGCIIFPGTIISNNVSIGDFVTIGCGSQIGHDSVIGQFSSLMASVDIGGKCILEEGVFMGTNSTCLPKKKICADSYIGSGSIVVRNINQIGTYFGNPAIKISDSLTR